LGRSHVVWCGRCRGCCRPHIFYHGDFSSRLHGVDRQKWTKRGNFASILKTVAGVGHLKTMWKDEFRGAGTVQETCSSEMLGGLGTDFWRGVGF
jgi:hypothetical protein